MVPVPVPGKKGFAFKYVYFPTGTLFLSPVAFCREIPPNRKHLFPIPPAALLHWRSETQSTHTPTLHSIIDAPTPHLQHAPATHNLTSLLELALRLTDVLTKAYDEALNTRPLKQPPLVPHRKSQRPHWPR